MTPAERAQAIRERIGHKLQAADIGIEDESHLHAGHPGARDGRGHFRVRVVSDHFEGLSAIQRHRLVYAAVGDLMQTDIHALTVVALSTTEAAQES